MTREKCISLSTEDAYKWIFEVPVDSKEFWRRHNFVNFDCGLSRLGIALTEPTRSGELICDME
jgi:hypothetical protein